MQKVIRLTDKIPRVDINHYLASSSEPSRVCVLSERDVTVIRSYLFPGVEWETRFVRPLGGDNYITATGEEYDEYLAMLSELDYRISGGLGMSLETALQSIAVALSAMANANSSVELQNVVRAIATSSACCEQQLISQGGGVIGRTTQAQSQEDIPIFGTEPLESVPHGGYPEGFDSLEEYQASKCEIATGITEGIIGTLRGLGAMGVFSGGALAGLIITAVVGLIVFPPAFIPIAAACIGFLSVNVTLLTLAANYIQDHKSEWVCALYNSDSTEAAISVVADLIDAMIASLNVEGGLGFWIKQLMLLLVNGDTLNQLMRKAAHLRYPDADCSGCNDNTLAWFVTQDNVTLGTGDLNYGGERVLTAVLWPQENLYYICFGDFDPNNPVDYRVIVHSLDGYANDEGGIIRNVAAQTLWSYHDNTPPEGTWCASLFQLGACPTPFTATVSIVEQC